MPDFLQIADIPAEELAAILEDAHKSKQSRLGKPKGFVDPEAPFSDCVVALIFDKPSTRTRLSFDVGVHQLGGKSIVVSTESTHRARGESVKDTALVLSRYVDLIMIRTFEDDILNELAQYSDSPVINGLTDSNHPCQILGDIMTFEEHQGTIKNKKVVWVGDGNNVCNSFLQAAGKFGFSLTFCGPQEFDPDASEIANAQEQGAEVILERDPKNCIPEADLIVTDTWVSIHEDNNPNTKLNSDLKVYQVNSTMMKMAKSDALFMHCLPAHREKEVTSEVLDGPQSVVFDEAENRLHIQKSIMKWCMGLL